ncbi:hypothetical protein TIFTF001_008116 [Ficus carica]|uniref:Importin N-terminal domain-containing protein n=1 Tax=Ficus carica TaxID=3494 RepID=A0AA88CXQ1_FICCA|nr:hypothetical protein TIFTF001_008116 [Ficus carica]
MANLHGLSDQDQQWLLNCLSATLDPSHEVRSFAEASLNQASLQPGFGSALAKVAANRELPLGLRQISFCYNAPVENGILACTLSYFTSFPPFR